jgi:hypothetical protein
MDLNLDPEGMKTNPSEKQKSHGNIKSGSTIHKSNVNPRSIKAKAHHWIKPTHEGVFALLV